MKLLTGAILLVGAEQAFAHSLLVQFPNQESTLDLHRRLLLRKSMFLTIVVVDVRVVIDIQLKDDHLVRYWKLLESTRTCHESRE